MANSPRRTGTRSERSKLRRWFAVALLSAVVLAGCGDDDPDTTAGGSTESTDMAEMGDMDTASDGRRDGAADRVIEVRMVAGLRYAPDAIEVTKGETITFKLKNEDKILHEFMLGDEEMQASHEKEMMEMSDEPMEMDDEKNAVTLKGGETKELTWTFDEAGTVLYGCHQPGHYDDGMKGTITVT